MANFSGKRITHGKFMIISLNAAASQDGFMESCTCRRRRCCRRRIRDPGFQPRVGQPRERGLPVQRWWWGGGVTLFRNVMRAFGLYADQAYLFENAVHSDIFVRGTANFPSPNKLEKATASHPSDRNTRSPFPSFSVNLFQWLHCCLERERMRSNTCSRGILT